MKNGSDALDVSIGIAEDRVKELTVEGVKYNDAVDKVLNDNSKHSIHKDFHTIIRKNLLQKQLQQYNGQSKTIDTNSIANKTSKALAEKVLERSKQSASK